MELWKNRQNQNAVRIKQKLRLFLKWISNATINTITAIIIVIAIKIIISIVIVVIVIVAVCVISTIILIIKIIIIVINFVFKQKLEENPAAMERNGAANPRSRHEGSRQQWRIGRRANVKDA